MLAVLRSERKTFDISAGSWYTTSNPCESVGGDCVAFPVLTVLDDQSKEEQFIDVYNTYKRLVYHTAYKIMGDSYLAEDVLQEVFLYVAKNFSKIHRENCHELAAYLVSCSRSRAYDMLRKQREEPLEEVPDAPDDAPVPDDAVVSTDNIQH